MYRIPKSEVTISEIPLRSLTKSIAFRTAIIIGDSIIIAVITQNASAIIPISLLTNFGSTVIFYLHERIWNKIKWLKEKNGFILKTKEKVIRSFIKSITFRILVLISDFIISIFIIESFTEAVGIMIATNLFSSILYFIQERIWNKISWGKEIIQTLDNGKIVVEPELALLEKKQPPIVNN